MSISLMTSIFKTEFRDLQDNEGNTTKASTAKFVCIALADHANDEGEGAYPSINKIALKTSLSRTAVINALDALKTNGILIANGASKYDTINYTVNPACFSQGSQPGVLVIPLDPPSQPEILPPVNPVDPNHPLTILKSSTETEEKPADPKHTGYARGDQERPDKLAEYLKMSQFPGAKKSERVNAILSYLAVTLNRKTTAKEWEEFAKEIDDHQQREGQKVEIFVAWLLSREKYNPEYWPVKKMSEFWQQAFVVENTQKDRPNLNIGIS